MSPPDAERPPGEGRPFADDASRHHLDKRDGITRVRRSPSCPLACSDPCPWATCPVPLEQPLDRLVGALIDGALAEVLA